jgi:hypothetical protein
MIAREGAKTRRRAITPSTAADGLRGFFDVRLAHVPRKPGPAPMRERRLAQSVGEGGLVALNEGRAPP